MFSSRETSEKVQQAFRLFLNVSPTVTSWSPANDEFSLVFEVQIAFNPGNSLVVTVQAHSYLKKPISLKKVLQVNKFLA
jgi:hypothetical protein